MKEIVEILITKEEIDKKLCEIASEIEKDYAGKEVVMICVLMGGMIFMSDLARKICNKVTIKFDGLVISSYGMSTESSETIELGLDTRESLTDKHVIVVEDIIDTGKTLKYIMNHIICQKPKSLKVCVLLDKSKRRVIDGLKIDYVGFNIEDNYVVGYGLDYAQKYRNLPFVASLTFTD